MTIKDFLEDPNTCVLIKQGSVIEVYSLEKETLDQLKSIKSKFKKDVVWHNSKDFFDDFTSVEFGIATETDFETLLCDLKRVFLLSIRYTNLWEGVLSYQIRDWITQRKYSKLWQTAVNMVPRN